MEEEEDKLVQEVSAKDSYTTIWKRSYLASMCILVGTPLVAFTAPLVLNHRKQLWPVIVKNNMTTLRVPGLTLGASAALSLLPAFTTGKEEVVVVEKTNHDNHYCSNFLPQHIFSEGVGQKRSKTNPLIAMNTLPRLCVLPLSVSA